MVTIPSLSHKVKLTPSKNMVQRCFLLLLPTQHLLLPQNPARLNRFQDPDIEKKGKRDFHPSEKSSPCCYVLCWWRGPRSRRSMPLPVPSLILFWLFRLYSIFIHPPSCVLCYRSSNPLGCFHPCYF